MSLWFQLHVNNKAIAGVSIQRITNTETGVLPDDTVSTYEVHLNGQAVGRVEHRYGDGPFSLVSKATTLADIWLRNHPQEAVTS
jgi:hypothetical protein